MFDSPFGQLNSDSAMFSGFTRRYTGNPALKWSLKITFLVLLLPGLVLLLLGLILGITLYVLFAQVIRIVMFVRGLLGLPVSGGAGEDAGGGCGGDGEDGSRENVRVIYRDD